MTRLTDVGVMIAARDAASTLAAAVASVVDDAAQVVIAVDPTDRRTWDTALALAARHPTVGVVDNPTGTAAAGLNSAAAALTGLAYLARVDAHTRPCSGYLSSARDIVVRTGAAVVGGVQVPVGEGTVAGPVAWAMTSRLGSGGARHRRGTTAGPSETAYLGVFRREDFDRIGGYDPELGRNQDYEICHRIRRAGGIVWFDPTLRVQYRPRSTWSDLAVQYHDYGRWKRRVMRDSPSSVRLRQIIPAALVPALAGAIGLALSGRRTTAGTIVSVYAGALATDVLTIPVGAPAVWTRARVALALAIMHLAWGSGFWRGGR